MWFSMRFWNLACPGFVGPLFPTTSTGMFDHGKIHPYFIQYVNGANVQNSERIQPMTLQRLLLNG
jgi:hypothetical protein